MSLLSSSNAFPMLEDNGNFVLWYKILSVHLTDCGIAGKAILNGKADYPVFPTPTDMLKDQNNMDTLIQKFDHTPAVYDGHGAITTPLQFIKDGLKDFKLAVIKFESTVDKFNESNNKVVHLILSHLGTDVKASAFNNPSFSAAVHSKISDTFAMIEILRTMFGKGTGRTVIKQLYSTLTFKQGNLSFPVYSEQLKEKITTMTANHESASHPGFISIDSLASAIFLGGVDPLAFKSKLEAYYVGNPTGTGVVSFADLTSDFQIYAREQTSDQPVDYASAMVAATSAIVKCLDCKVPITGVALSGRPHTRCKTCFQLFRSRQKESEKPGPIIVKPTKDVVLGARSLVAKKTAVSDVTTLVTSDEDDD